MTSDPNALLERVRNLNPEQMDTLSHILDAIEATKSGPTSDAARRPLSDFEFCGIWADRDDMKDGGDAWVRRIRENDWRRTFAEPE